MYTPPLADGGSNGRRRTTQSGLRTHLHPTQSAKTSLPSTIHHVRHSPFILHYTQCVVLHIMSNRSITTCSVLYLIQFCSLLMTCDRKLHCQRLRPVVVILRSHRYYEITRTFIVIRQIFENTVKPVYKDHPMETGKVVSNSRWSLQTSS